MNVLEVENLHVRYGRVTAVEGVTLQLGEGEMVGLIGANGAGKSSTLAAITGMAPPSEGSIKFDGTSIVGQSPERIARQGVSLVPEGRHVFGSLSVEENLRLGTVGRRNAQPREALQDVFERFPVLERYRETSAGKLSGGEQQQLAIGRALISKPRLLLLDEPSLGLAPLMVDLVFDSLARLHSEGVAILLVEQNAGRTIESSDRTYLLTRGRVAFEGDSAAFDANVNIAEAYLGEESDHELG